MTEQRMVPVELLEDLLEFLLCHSNRWDGHTKHPQLIVEQARAIIDGRGSDLPPQYPKQAKTMLICDGEDVSPAEVGHWFSPEYIAELLAAPSAPVQRLPEGCAWAVTKGGHSICQPPKSWDKQASAQAVPDGVVEALQSLKEQVASILCHKLGHPGTAMAVQDAVIRLINRALTAATQPPSTAQPSAVAYPLVDDPEGRN